MTSSAKPANFPAPDGLRRLTTFFAVNNCAKAIDFYVEAFSAWVRHRMDGPGGVVWHAELEIADIVVQLSDPLPEIGIVGPPAEGNAFTLLIWTEDVDAVYEKAIKLGATAISPVDDVFSGDRMGTLRCPFGVRWAIGRHDRDVPPDEIHAAVTAWIESPH